MDTRVERVDRLRLWVLVLLRVAAVVWAAVAFQALAGWIQVITRTLQSRDNFDGLYSAFQNWDGVEVTIVALGHVAGVVILAVFSRKLACWIVPAANACPACGYNIGGVKAARCPECGQSLGAGPRTVEQEPR